MSEKFTKEEEDKQVVFTYWKELGVYCTVTVSTERLSTSDTDRIFDQMAQDDGCL